MATLALAAACSAAPRAAPHGASVAPAAWPVYAGVATRAPYATVDAPAAVTEAWSVDAGKGLVSPVIAGGPILIATATSRDVTALDPVTGDRYWQRRVAGAILGGAILHDGRIFVATGDESGRALALDQSTGAELWSVEVGPALHPPAYSGGRVHVATETGVVASLDAETGAVAWRIRLPRPAASAPTPTTDGDRLVVAAQDTLYVLSTATGVIQWRSPLGAPAAAEPAMRGEMLFVPLRSGQVVAYSLDARREAWRVSFGEQPILAAPVAGADGSLYVLDRATDIWRVPRGGTSPELVARLGGAAASSLTLVSGGLLVGRVDGALFLVRSGDGSVVWRHDFGEAIRAPVTLHDGAIYVPLLRGSIVKLRQAP